MSFEQFNVDPRCLEILTRQGIKQPTPIQERAIPAALEGRDVLAIAQTGTGKTLGFALPSVTRLAADRPVRNSMLVVTPTRELAHQVKDVLDPLARAVGLKTLCLYGGTDMRKQVRDLKQGAHIIVATPGRLLDHVRSRNIRFDQLSILVLDEADQMLDMGFLPDIRRIIAELPADRQTLMFSATFPPNISKLAADMQTDPVRIEVGRVATPTASVRQGAYNVESTKKLHLLSKILSEPHVETALVFMRTKRRTDKVAKALHKAGFKVEAIHGDRSQSQRQRALDGFKKGRFNILVATDVAARGIDVRGITHVVNFDIPATSEDYVHRIGRTARANATGDAITFVSPEEHRDFGSIERAIGIRIPREVWDGAGSVIGSGTEALPEAKRREPTPRAESQGENRRFDSPRPRRRSNGDDSRKNSRVDRDGATQSRARRNGSTRDEGFPRAFAKGPKRSESAGSGRPPRRSNRNRSSVRSERIA